MLNVNLCQKCPMSCVKDMPDGSVYCHVRETILALGNAIIRTMACWVGKVDDQSPLVGGVAFWDNSKTTNMSHWYSGLC